MNKCFAGERLTTIGSNVNETEISQHPPQTQRLTYAHRPGICLTGYSIFVNCGLTSVREVSIFNVTIIAQICRI